jgi:HlyD family secretion protein
MASPQTPVFTVALNDPVWARAYVSETDLGKVFPGMRGEILTDSFPGKSYEGWVGFISPTAEFTPKQVETTELRSKLVYRLRVLVCNPQNELRLGMPVTVTLRLDQDRTTAAANPAASCKDR